MTNRLVVAAILLFALMLVGGCRKGQRSPTQKQSQSATTPKKPTAKPKPAPKLPGDELPSCCPDNSSLARLTNQRVRLEGRYRAVDIGVKGIRELAAPARPGNALVILDNGLRIVLGVYYRKSAERSLAELKKFNNRRVRVLGKIWLVTPVQRVIAHEVETHPFPYLTNVTLFPL